MQTGACDFSAHGHRVQRDVEAVRRGMPDDCGLLSTLTLQIIMERVRYLSKGLEELTAEECPCISSLRPWLLLLPSSWKVKVC